MNLMHLRFFLNILSYFGQKSGAIKSELSYSLSQIHNIAKAFWQVAKNYRVIAFNGDMGTGKTTFIHTLCDYLNVKDVVSSPTFALINEYHFEDEDGKDRLIYHMDLYRINGIEEAMQAGIEDAIMNNKACCFIEWPVKVITLLPKPYLAVNIEATDDIHRTLSYEEVA